MQVEQDQVRLTVASWRIALAVGRLAHDFHSRLGLEEGTEPLRTTG